MPAPLPGSSEQKRTVCPSVRVTSAVPEGTNSRSAIQSPSFGSPPKVRATYGMRCLRGSAF